VTTSHVQHPDGGAPRARWRKTEPQPSVPAGCGQPSQAAAPAWPPLQPPVRSEHIETHMSRSASG
jgi:hypothetical protein